MLAREEACFKRRARFILAIFWASFVAVAGRSAQLQIQQHHHLSALAHDQHVNTIKVPAKRGHLYDRYGNPLAISVDVPSVYAHPLAVVDAPKTAKLLSSIIDIKPSVLLEKFKSERYFVWIKRQVTPQIADKIQALALPGIYLTKEPQRFYPNRDVGAHMLGFVGLDGRGLEGIEKQLDWALLGEGQAVTAFRDAKGKVVLDGSLDPEQRAMGQDARLSIDLQLQHVVQRALDDAVRSTSAQSAMAVVLDVASADILAMAVAPGFNANRAALEKPDKRRNRIVTDVFEPGSTLKPLVMAAALDSGVVKPETELFCENGRLQIDKHVVTDTSSHGMMPLADIIAKSSNIGMVKVGHLLGKHRLEQALRKFGFGQRTGVEIPGETSGILRASDKWSELETGTIAFGQGLAVNELQLAAAYRVLAAGGMYRQPRLLQRLERPDGAWTVPQIGKEWQVIRAEAAQQVTNMLEAAVVPGSGTGRRANIAGYRVAGKTGTAQKSDPMTGRYSHDRYVALFAGYLPAQAPRVVIVVSIDEPQGNHLGGVVAAPVFATIAQASMQRLGVVPSLDANDAIPTQIALAQLPTPPPTNHTDVAELPKIAGKSSSLIGLTARRALETLAQLQKTSDMEIQIVGTGLVVRQQLSNSRQAGKLGQLRLELEP